MTITPDEGLIESFRLRAGKLGSADQYRRITATDGASKELVKDPDTLNAALNAAVEKAIAEKSVSAIVIGSGPLFAPALRIQPRFQAPLVVAVAAATRAALADLDKPDK